ncbi:unnamed protein product [Dovyalis caffra]|uniref:Uncharacterized protein n=1 Tax=Dovyalis caffra TaxID=77055 RepID=A0AAV1S181_9ROSI|nr:unnamed protein product [Dovyalis caffra]
MDVYLSGLHNHFLLSFPIFRLRQEIKAGVKLHDPVEKKEDQIKFYRQIDLVTVRSAVAIAERKATFTAERIDCMIKKG